MPNPSTGSSSGAVPGTGIEVALISFGAAVLGVGVATFAGASLAVSLFGQPVTPGPHVGGGVGEWLIVTWRFGSGEAPAVAWRDNATGVPNGIAYWGPATLAYGLLLTLVAGAVRLWRVTSRPKVRHRFGQPTDAYQAKPKDLKPLRIDSLVPPTGRMLLGRMVGHKKVLLATEDRERHPLKSKAADRQGNRGSVALIGPTGSGKDSGDHCCHRHMGRTSGERERETRPVRHHRRSTFQGRRDRSVRSGSCDRSTDGSLVTVVKSVKFVRGVADRASTSAGDPGGRVCLRQIIGPSTGRNCCRRSWRLPVLQRCLMMMVLHTR